MSTEVPTSIQFAPSDEVLLDILKEEIRKSGEDPKEWGLHLGMPNTEWLLAAIMLLNPKSKLLGMGYGKHYPMYTV